MAGRFFQTTPIVTKQFWNSSEEWNVISYRREKGDPVHVLTYTKQNVGKVFKTEHQLLNDMYMQVASAPKFSLLSCCDISFIADFAIGVFIRQLRLTA